MQSIKPAAIEVARITVRPEAIEEFEAGIDSSIAVILDWPAAQGAHLLRCIEDRSYILMITWDSVEDHKAFAASEEFERYRSFIADTLAELPVVFHYEVITGQGVSVPA